jgi:hypothetical protein
MDDPLFDPFSSARQELKGPNGPFRKHEELPRTALKWKNYVDPVTKSPKPLIDFTWQLAAMLRMLVWGKKEMPGSCAIGQCFVK